MFSYLRSRIETIGEGAGKLGLYIQKLQEKDTGIYNCTAVYAGNQNLHVSIDIRSYGELSLYLLYLVSEIKLFLKFISPNCC